MSEGLEISEVKSSYVLSSNDIFRLDSNFFRKEFLREESIVRKGAYQTLASIGIELRSFGAYSLNNLIDYLDNGIPFIRGVNMKGGRVSFSDLIYIDEESHGLLWKSEVKPEMILLSMSGTIGEVAIASKSWNYPINSNQDIAKIDTRGKVNPYYLYVFLLSKFGQNYLVREARGSVQQHVFLSQIEQFEIPIFSDKFEREIQVIVEKSELVADQAQTAYARAESLLLENLGLTNFLPSLKSFNVKSFKESFLNTGRLDAELYQPKFELLVSILNKDGLRIQDVAKVRKQPFEKRKSGTFDYIEIGNLNGDGTANSELLFYAEAPSRATQTVAEGDVITSTVRPIRRLSAIISNKQKDFVCSSGFIVLEPMSIFSEVLLVYLRLPIFCELMDLYTSASMYPAISEKDLLGLPIPNIQAEIQQDIAALIRNSFSFKNKSEQLLELAKHAVEVAIEADEDTAIIHINRDLERLNTKLDD